MYGVLFVVSALVLLSLLAIPATSYTMLWDKFFSLDVDLELSKEDLDMPDKDKGV